MKGAFPVVVNWSGGNRVAIQLVRLNQILKFNLNSRTRTDGVDISTHRNATI